MADEEDVPTSGFQLRLNAIENLERELIRKAAALINPGSRPMYMADTFLFGAASRTLSQAKGFRELIQSKNFPCAAAIIRLQIDTAMRINGLRFVEDIEACCKELFNGKQFDQIKDKDGQRLRDVHLRKLLAAEYPWIELVYKDTSDLIHLSMKHLWTSIARTDEKTGMVYFQFSGTDPHRPDETYFEALDAMFQATKLASLMILGCLSAIHSPPKSQPISEL